MKNFFMTTLPTFIWRVIRPEIVMVKCDQCQQEKWQRGKPRTVRVFASTVFRNEIYEKRLCLDCFEELDRALFTPSGRLIKK